MILEERWDEDDPRILHVRMLDPVQWEEIQTLQHGLAPEDFPPRWAVLVDFGQVRRIPQISVPHMARIVNGTPPGSCGFAIVHAGLFLRALLPLLGRMYPSIQAKFLLAESEDEARVWLVARLGPAAEGGTLDA